MLILIYGITGLCGQACARAALRAGHKVRGLARNPDKLDADISGRLESFIKMDSIYDIQALDRATANVDTVISACAPLAEVVVEGQILLLRAAERAGVKVFHGASWNCDWTKIELGYLEPYDPLIIFWNYARLTSPLKLVFGFTGAILESMISSPFTTPIRDNKKTGAIPGDGDYTWTYTTVDDLAAYTIQAVSEPNSLDNGLYYVQSFKCTPRELLKTYERVRGVKLEIRSTFASEEAEQQLQDARAMYPPHKHPEYLPTAYNRFLNQPWAFDIDPIHSRKWSHIKQTTWEEWLIAHPDV